MHPISLRPIVFQKMMRLPKLNKELKILEANAFITNNDGTKGFLTYFIGSFSGVNTNAHQFDIDFLKETFREFSWLFVWVTDQDSTT